MENTPNLDRKVGQVELALRRELISAEGKYRAFALAVKCEGDIPQLQAEIQSVEESIIAGLLENPLGAMSPGKGPRIYKDHYLSGLYQAIEIISTIKSKDE